MGIKRAYSNLGTMFALKHLFLSFVQLMLGIEVMHQLAQFIDGQFSVLRVCLSECGQHLGDGAVFANVLFKTDDTGDQVLEFCQGFGRRQ